MHDTLRKIETPEGVELDLRVAGPASRFLAWLVDLLIKFAVLMVASTVLPFLGSFGIGVFLVAYFALLWFYNVLFEIYHHGATPGKRSLHIRVVNRNGTPVDWSGSVIRNLVRFIDALPFVFYGFGLVAMLLNRDFQRLGDMAAGTLVVHDVPAAGYGKLAGDEARPLRIPLTLEEQRAVIAFGERLDTVTQERAEELAGVLDGVVLQSGEGVGALRAYANWLAGRSQ